MPDLNELAPDFTLPDADGTPVTLSELRGGPVVLYFYPKDNTPGCTKQAIGFTDSADAFAAAGAKVLGVSKDSIKKHDNFRTKYDLAVALLSDAENDVCETYGVWQEKKMYGKTFFGIVRTTILIDSDGKIAKIWPKVKVDGHIDEVLDAVKSL